MKDLISRAELDRLLAVTRDDGYITKYEYDLLSELVGQVPSAEAEVKCIARINVDVEEVVRRIKEEYEITDGWIPCSERLPEESGEYLVSYHTNFLGECIDIVRYGKPLMPNDEDYKQRNCFYGTSYDGFDVVCRDVTAWMPLPKPYVESEVEE